MNLLFAFISSLVVRGNHNGFLFCNIQGIILSQRLLFHEARSRKSFVNFVQGRFTEIGVGSSTVQAHTGHSLKRGGVQLLGFLGCKDLFIINWFGMTGQTAYLRYTEGYNDASGVRVPDFAFSEAMLAHARARYMVEDIMNLEEGNQVRDWLLELDSVQ